MLTLDPQYVDIVGGDPQHVDIVARGVSGWVGGSVGG